MNVDEANVTEELAQDPALEAAFRAAMAPPADGAEPADADGKRHVAIIAGAVAKRLKWGHGRRCHARGQARPAAGLSAADEARNSITSAAHVARSASCVARQWRSSHEDSSSAALVREVSLAHEARKACSSSARSSNASLPNAKSDALPCDDMPGRRALRPGAS